MITPRRAFPQWGRLWVWMLMFQTFLSYIMQGSPLPEEYSQPHVVNVDLHSQWENVELNVDEPAWKSPLCSLTPCWRVLGDSHLWEVLEAVWPLWVVLLASCLARQSDNPLWGSWPRHTSPLEGGTHPSGLVAHHWNGIFTLLWV